MTNEEWEIKFKEACKSLKASEIEKLVDLGYRHRTDKQPNDYLQHWLRVARHFGYATHDDSWGEFEKKFAIIIKRLVILKSKVDAIEYIINEENT